MFWLQANQQIALHVNKTQHMQPILMALSGNDVLQSLLNWSEASSQEMLHFSYLGSASHPAEPTKNQQTSYI